MAAVPASRVVLASVLVAWMIGGPVWVQLIGGSKGDWVRTWRMYRRHAEAVCKVALYEQRGDERVAIDRLEALGYPDGAPRSVELIRGRKQVERQVRLLCHRHPDRDLRLAAHCAGPLGWNRVRTARRPLCP